MSQKESSTNAADKLSERSPQQPVEDAVETRKARRARFEAWVADADAAINELCEYVLEGGFNGHLAGFCRDKRFPYNSVLNWVNESGPRAAMYARAREDRSDALAEETLDLAATDCSVPIMGDVEKVVDGELKILHVEVGRKVDNGKVNHLKLQVDTRKWLASKLKPKVFGDKLELGGQVDVKNVSDEALVQQLAAFGLGAAAAAALNLPAPPEEGRGAIGP